MSERSDKKLEEQGWQAMSRLLDEEMPAGAAPQAAGISRSWLLLLLLLFLFGGMGIGWYLADKGGDNEYSPEKKTIQQDAEPQAAAGEVEIPPSALEKKAVNEISGILPAEQGTKKASLPLPVTGSTPADEPMYTKENFTDPEPIGKNTSNLVIDEPSSTIPSSGLEATSSQTTGSATTGTGGSLLPLLPYPKIPLLKSPFTPDFVLSPLKPVRARPSFGVGAGSVSVVGTGSTGIQAGGTVRFPIGKSGWFIKNETGIRTIRGIALQLSDQATSRAGSEAEVPGTNGTGFSDPVLDFLGESAFPGYGSQTELSLRRWEAYSGLSIGKTFLRRFQASIFGEIGYQFNQIDQFVSHQDLQAGVQGQSDPLAFKRMDLRAGFQLAYRPVSRLSLRASWSKGLLDRSDMETWAWKEDHLSLMALWSF